MIEGATKRKLEKISKGELDDLKDMVLKDKDDDVVDEIEELYEDENDERCVTYCLSIVAPILRSWPFFVFGQVQFYSYKNIKYANMHPLEKIQKHEHWLLIKGDFVPY